MKREQVERFLAYSAQCGTLVATQASPPTPQDELSKQLVAHRSVACERPDGTLNIHLDTETCDICEAIASSLSDTGETQEKNGTKI